MRIIIDLQALQIEGTDAAIDLLNLTKDLAGMAPPHEVWLALNLHFGSTINALRDAFKGIVPDECVVVFDIPVIAEPGTPSHAWTLRAAEQIRAGFLASLNPDVVLAPYLLEANDRHVISAIVPSFDQFLTIALAGDTLVKKLARRDEDSYRQLATLKRATKIIAPSATVAANMRDHLDDTTTKIVVNTDVEAIWATLFAAFSEHQSKSPQQKRKKLAFVSPLPPEKSGIADYSVELLAELALYYEIELILDQPLVSIPWIQANFIIRNRTWFEAHADEYDHVLYQIGNSDIHKHMFEMLEQHPGVVVLHDFFLSNVLEYIDNNGYAPDIFSRAIYQSHGLSGLIDQKKIGHTESIWKYPCNKAVLEHATGVIVHSQHSAELARSWYGEHGTANWRSIPLIRGHHGSQTSGQETRQKARHQLGFSDSDFIVCSFGMMQMTKCNDNLLDAWLNSLLANDAHCQLVFVGEVDRGEYGEQIKKKIAQHKTGKRVTITGFVSHENYNHYLAAADLAVQLRSRSRGETSASVLDCLLHGLPTIVNAHGSVVELPDSVLVKLADKFSLNELSEALNTVWQDASLREKLSQASRQHIATHHTPSQVGKLYFEAIESFRRQSPKQHYLELIKAVSRIGTPSPNDLTLAAIAIAANQASTGTRQLLIDISVLVQFDHRTGIQRVVRSILTALFENPPCGYRIEPVYSPGGGEEYRYAHRFVQDWLKCAIPDADDPRIEVRAGDIFLGLDLYLSGTQQNEALLQRYKNRGMQIYFVVYDILPVLRPDVFPEGTEADFSGWLHMISRISTGLVCISEAVAEELSNWIQLNCAQHKNNVNINYFHLGADIIASQPSLGLTPDAVEVLKLMGACPSLLMVGTLEPRKGHAQALAAFELLWAEGIEVKLVIVGKNGWMVNELVERLQNHAENGKHLLWLQNISDEMLLQLYETATGLLAVSEGEGFGLPLIEAAQHGLPIIARKLPVFVEVMGEHAYYFDGLRAETLADTIRRWLLLLKENKAPQSTGMQWLTWQESAQQLLDSVLQHHINDEEVIPSQLSQI